MDDLKHIALSKRSQAQKCAYLHACYFYGVREQLKITHSDRSRLVPAWGRRWGGGIGSQRERRGLPGATERVCPLTAMVITWVYTFGKLIELYA